jgi:hypothetical protein
VTNEEIVNESGAKKSPDEDIVLVKNSVLLPKIVTIKEQVDEIISDSDVRLKGDLIRKDFGLG